MDTRVSLAKLHDGTQLLSDINLLFALDGLFTPYVRSGAAGSPGDRSELGAIAENMKLLIDKITNQVSWVKEVLDAEPELIRQNLSAAIDQIPTSVVFAEKRARFREMVRSGEFIERLGGRLDSISSIAQRTKEELDAALAEFDQSGSSAGDLWSVGACVFAGVGLIAATALQLHAAVIGIMVTIVGNCVEF